MPLQGCTNHVMVKSGNIREGKSGRKNSQEKSGRKNGEEKPGKNLGGNTVRENQGGNCDFGKSQRKSGNIRELYKKSSKILKYESGKNFSKCEILHVILIFNYL